MSQSLFSAKTGIRAQQQRLDIIGNNLSNANTNGYKSVRADFKDAIYQTLRRPVQPQSELNLELGHGTLLGATMRDFRVGSMQNTGNTLDMMIAGDGFFTVLSPQGETQYTRNGTFYLSNEADGQYLTTGNGYYVLDEDGERILMNMTITETDDDGNTVTRQANISELTIDNNGYMYFGDNPPFAQIGMRAFDNPQGLEAVGSSNFIPTVESGEARALDQGVQLKQGYLEMSGTDLANEMVRMIRTQRAMQLSSRALTTADQMMGLVNSARR